MRQKLRDGASIAIAALCIALAIPALLAEPMAFTGITLRMDGAELVVDTVDPRSRWLDGAGMVVRDINYTAVEDIPPKSLDQYLRGDFFELGVADPHGPYNATLQVTFPPQAGVPGAFAFIVGIGLLIGAAIWVRRGLAGTVLVPVAIPLAVASAAPMILMAATWSWSPFDAPATYAVLALPALAMLTLSDGFSERVLGRIARRAAVVVAVSAFVGYLVAAFRFFAMRLSDAPYQESEFLTGLTVALSAAITLGPAIILVRTGPRVAVSTSAPTLRSTHRLPVLLAALTPTVIATTNAFAFYGFSLSIPVIWLLVVVVLLDGRARTETLRLQRDTVVAATEVERARLAADLHDDALQEMTVLVRRLDAGGDARAAELARTIADRLREVCGDLRLPVLDELGAGPALEWLVTRVGEASGHPVRLERGDTARPPAEVELAVFRVAQEALANAVTHGAPPVVVRYAATSDQASLSITDHGAGIAPDASALAPRAGHYGLLNMRQRAEQIGGRIEVRRPPDGGTVIGLRWAAS